MNRDETKLIIAGMKAAYPNYNPSDLLVAVEIWSTMLADYSYEQVNTALKIFIRTDTKGFAPSIGQIIDKIHVVDHMSELSEMEAWGLVSKALRNGTYHAEEEFNKLPKTVQKAIGDSNTLHNWATTSVESVENVIQSNFCRSYRTVLKRKEEYEKLPSEVTQLLDNTTSKMIEVSDEVHG